MSSSDEFEMPTYASFLSSIVQSPAADGPRLAFADWLEEQGERPRAELIRVQCELARGCAGGARLVQLTLRQLELISRHEQTWLGPLRAHFYSRVSGFERGLIPQVFFGMAEFLRPKTQRTATEWFPRAGVLGLCLSNRTRSLPDLYDCPLLHELCSLTLEHAALGDDGIGRLVAGKACENLRSLTWIEHQASGAGLHHLADAASLRRLTSLTLGHIPFRSAALVALLESPHLRSLTTLCLSGARHWKDDLPLLAESPGWRRLRELHLRDVDLNGSEFRCLLSPGRLAGLRKLYLSGNCLRSLGADALASRGALKNLETLDFSLDHNFDSIDLSHLMAALYQLPALKHLSVNAPFFASLPEYLALLSRLESLDVRYCCLEEPSVRALLASRKLAHLRKLNAEGYEIDNKAISSLLRGVRRRRLQELELSVCGPAAEVARTILDSGAYPGLIRLRLSGKAPSARRQANLQRQYPHVLLEF
jgi:uncharacterized protein (TIGR02996 family)